MVAASAKELPREAQIKFARRAIAVIWTLCALGIVGFIVYIAEDAKPGYSFVSQLVRSAESVATAQKAAEKREADNDARAQASMQQAQKSYAERRFVEINTRSLSRVHCQNTKTWQGLSEADKQRIRDYIKKDYGLLIESDACP